MPGRRTVLMVDDDPDVMAVAADMFDLLGFNVVMADSPHAGLDVLRAMGDQVDLIFTDIAMPEMDGHAFAASARHITPGAGIIYTSGQMPIRDDVVFVRKPYTSAALAEATERVARAVAEQ